MRDASSRPLSVRVFTIKQAHDFIIPKSREHQLKTRALRGRTELRTRDATGASMELGWMPVWECRLFGGRVHVPSIERYYFMEAFGTWQILKKKAIEA